MNAGFDDQRDDLAKALHDWWPTAEEQKAERDNEKCSCICVDPGSTGPDPQPSEWEQDPYCALHPEMRIVRATLRKLARR